MNVCDGRRRPNTRLPIVNKISEPVGPATPQRRFICFWNTSPSESQTSTVAINGSSWARNSGLSVLYSLKCRSCSIVWCERRANAMCDQLSVWSVNFIYIIVVALVHQYLLNGREAQAEMLGILLPPYLDWSFIFNFFPFSVVFLWEWKINRRSDSSIFLASLLRNFSVALFHCSHRPGLRVFGNK